MYYSKLFSNDPGMARPNTNNNVLKNRFLSLAIRDYTKFPFTSEILTESIVHRNIKITLTNIVKFNLDRILRSTIFNIPINPLIDLKENDLSFFILSKILYKSKS